MPRRPGQKAIPKTERLRAVAAIVTRQSSLEGEAQLELRIQALRVDEEIARPVL